MNPNIFSRLKWFAATAAVVLLIFAFFWQNLMMAIAIMSAEKRPVLLHDAEWGKPVPSFSQQFGEGSSEKELLTWLADNEFEIAEKRHASRIVGSLPCNELVEVSWTVANEQIWESRAIVSEAGCL